MFCVWHMKFKQVENTHTHTNTHTYKHTPTQNWLCLDDVVHDPQTNTMVYRRWLSRHPIDPQLQRNSLRFLQLHPECEESLWHHPLRAGLQQMWRAPIAPDEESTTLGRDVRWRIGHRSRWGYNLSENGYNPVAPKFWTSHVWLWPSCKPFTTQLKAHQARLQAWLPSSKERRARGKRSFRATNSESQLLAGSTPKQGAEEKLPKKGTWGSVDGNKHGNKWYDNHLKLGSRATRVIQYTFDWNCTSKHATNKRCDNLWKFQCVRNWTWALLTPECARKWLSRGEIIVHGENCVESTIPRPLGMSLNIAAYTNPNQRRR